MLQRREFLGAIPLSALAIGSTVSVAEEAAKNSAATESSVNAAAIIVSPPVVQHPTARGFTVVWQINQLATGWVEWGWSADKLDQIARASHHGLIDAADDVLAVPVVLAKDAPGETIHYRMAVQTLGYKNAYKLERGETAYSEPFQVTLPNPTASQSQLVVINDTHENRETIAALAKRINELAPPMLLWNGDTCNDFDEGDSPATILLNPGGDAASRGADWAASRPLLFVPGNHDVRGARARELQRSMRPWNDSPQPYNFAFRHGPLAIVSLDTGEDKPDAHPVFAGTAAYEPYRAAQAVWLREVVDREEIRTAPFRVVFCHIPLRGIPGDPSDGTTLKAAAHHCGDGARHWLPILRAAKFHAIVSGHMHEWRIDDPSPDEPLTQIVGGGPSPKTATLIRVDCSKKELKIVIEDLQQNVLGERVWRA
jgi:predicted phosphodiesterase